MWNIFKKLRRIAEVLVLLLVVVLYLVYVAYLFHTTTMNIFYRNIYAIFKRCAKKFWVFSRKKIIHLYINRWVIFVSVHEKYKNIKRAFDLVNIFILILNIKTSINDVKELWGRFVWAAERNPELWLIFISVVLFSISIMIIVNTALHDLIDLITHFRWK